MNNEEQEGGKPIEPLEPGRPDVMPNPPPQSGGRPETEGGPPLDNDEELTTEEDMTVVEVNDSVVDDHPAQR